MEKTVLLLVVAVVLAGCVGGDTSPEPEEVRDGFLGDGNNVSSYAYESETAFEIGVVGREGTQTNTTVIDAVIDYEKREMSAETTAGPGTNQTTTSYIVNGTQYDRTVRGTEDTGWVTIDDPSVVNMTWEARDELPFYVGVLQKASVSAASERTGSVDAHALRVELNETERMEFLTGKIRGRTGFLSGIRIDGFNSTVWISEGENRLLRAETEMSVVAPDQRTRAGVLDMRADMKFVDEFSYDEPVEIELPEEARNTLSG